MPIRGAIIMLREKILLMGNQTLDLLYSRQLYNYYIIQIQVPSHLKSHIFIRMVLNWKTKKGKTSEFLDAGGYNRNERAGK